MMIHLTSQYHCLALKSKLSLGSNLCIFHQTAVLLLTGNGQTDTESSYCFETNITFWRQKWTRIFVHSSDIIVQRLGVIHHRTVSSNDLSYPLFITVQTFALNIACSMH